MANVMTSSPLAIRLQMKVNQSIVVLNAPAGYLDQLSPLPAGCTLTTNAQGQYDFVQLFAQSNKELEESLPSALSALKPEAMLWISYPKKGGAIKTDLSRDIGWSLVETAGLQPIRQIAIDETWSALRFKMAEHKTADSAIDAQYAGAKAGLRPIYERLVAAARTFGDDVIFETRQSYVALGRGRHFAAIQPTTKTRLDLALKLKGHPTSERLQVNTGVGSSSMTHKVALATPDDVDAEVLEWLRLAYAQ